MRLHIDLETRSEVELPRVGQYRYGEHPSTAIILAAWALDNEPFRCWQILAGEPVSTKFVEAVLDPDTTFVAHVAAFERTQLTIVGHPDRQGFLPYEVWNELRKPERWDCTACRAAAVGLPRSLEKVAYALGLQHQKDKAGQGIMMTMCRPNGYDQTGKPIWVQGEWALKRLGLYCIEDGEVEREADRFLPPLTPFERQVVAVTERMNDRGIMVDTHMLGAMQTLALETTRELNTRVIRLSKGFVPGVTNPQKMIAWLKSEFGLDFTDESTGKETLNKWMLAGLLDDAEVPDLAKELLTIRRDGGKTSVGKLQAIRDRVNDDHRLRGALIYGGAPATLRYSSYGAQLHNLPRNKALKNSHAAVAAVKTGLMSPETIAKTFGPPMVVISELIRPTFIAPPGHWLVRGDYSQIEARITALIAGHVRRLKMFQDYDTIIGTDEKGEPVRAGPDVYITSAADALGIPVADVGKQDRQAGKAVELAFGFLGGVGALNSAERIYNITIPGDKAEIVHRWREANAPVVTLGNDLMRAAVDCMRNLPGKEYKARHNISFRQNGTVLQMRMPSGRTITYWYPRFEDVEKFGKIQESLTYYAEDSQRKRWRRWPMWRGLLVENCLAGDSEVLTNHGWKRLDTVTESDRVWDGIEWVNHDGLINKGTQNVINFGGIKATAEHKVLTPTGMVACSATSFTVASETFRQSYRIPKSFVNSRKFSGIWRACTRNLAIPLRLWQFQRYASARLRTGGHQVLRLYDLCLEAASKTGERNTLYVGSPGVCGVAFNVGAVFESKTSSVSQLRGTRHHRLGDLAGFFRGFLGRYGANLSTRFRNRTNRKQQRLFQAELPMGTASRSNAEQKDQYDCQYSVGTDDCRRSSRPRGYWSRHTVLPDQQWLARPSSFHLPRSDESCVVYDLLNAGPRHRFTVRGVNGQPIIVSNCVQATARDIMAYALVQLEQRGMKPLMSVHDEAICQLLKETYPTATDAVNAVLNVMQMLPAWAQGLPIAADASADDRYIKS